MTLDPADFDPWALIGALERHRVNYVVIGAFAAVLHGSDEITTTIEICPQLKPENLDRLRAALVDLDAPLLEQADQLTNSSTVTLETSAGQIRAAARPVGSSGWDDLRRGSTREPLGRGLRVTVASVDDLARLITSVDGSADLARLQTLRRIAELDRGRGI